MDRRTFNTNVGLLACLPITGISKKKVGDVKHITIISKCSVNIERGNLELPCCKHTIEIWYTNDTQETYSVSSLIYKFLSNKGEIIQIGKQNIPPVRILRLKGLSDRLEIELNDRTICADIIKRIS